MCDGNIDPRHKMHHFYNEGCKRCHCKLLIYVTESQNIKKLIFQFVWFFLSVDGYEALQKKGKKNQIFHCIQVIIRLINRYFLIQEKNRVTIPTNNCSLSIQTSKEIQQKVVWAQVCIYVFRPKKLILTEIKVVPMTADIASNTFKVAKKRAKKKWQKVTEGHSHHSFKVNTQD